MKRLGFAIIALPLIAQSFSVMAQVYEPPLDTPFNPRTPPPQIALPKTPIPSIVAIPPASLRASKPVTLQTPPTPNAAEPLEPIISTPGTPQASTTVIDRSAHAKAPVEPPIAAQATDYVPGQVIVGKAKAYDGHSLLVNGHPIRLDGIDAPGLTQTCYTTSMTVWNCGKRALNLLERLVLNGNMSCIVTSSAGHGAAAICSTLEIKDVGMFLIKEGFAIPNGLGRSKYANEVNTAKNNRSGIWAGSFVDPKIWRARNQ